MGKIKGKFAHTYDNFVKRNSLLPNGLLELVRANNADSILELGCGTGTVAVGLSSNGFKVTGLDYSDDMLKAAKNKAAVVDNKPEFLYADITDFELSENFDLILCLGNTFPLISKLSDSRKVLRNCVNHLNPGGTAIFQQLNYDYFLKNKIKTFAIDNSSGIIRIKQYKYGKNLVDFFVTIIDTSNSPPKISTTKTKIRPWVKQDMVREFKNAGFKKVSAYGSYCKDRFSLKSKDLILAAKL